MKTNRQAVLAVWLGLAGILLPEWAGNADAHPAYLTAAHLTVEKDGSFKALLRFDTLAYALNDTSARIGNEPMEALLAGPREDLEAQLSKAKERFRRGFRVVTDAGDATFDLVAFPDAEKVLQWRDTVKPVLPVVVPVEVSGHLPRGAKTVAARFPPVLEQVVLTVERPGEEPSAEAVDNGALSTALPVRLENIHAG